MAFSPPPCTIKMGWTVCGFPCLMFCVQQYMYLNYLAHYAARIAWMYSCSLAVQWMTHRSSDRLVNRPMDGPSTVQQTLVNRPMDDPSTVRQARKPSYTTSHPRVQRPIDRPMAARRFRVHAKRSIYSACAQLLIDRDLLDTFPMCKE